MSGTEVSVTEEKIFYLKMLLQRLYQNHHLETDESYRKEYEERIQSLKNEIAKERSKL